MNLCTPRRGYWPVENHVKPMSKVAKGHPKTHLHLGFIRFPCGLAYKTPFKADWGQTRPTTVKPNETLRNPMYSQVNLLSFGCWQIMGNMKPHNPPWNLLKPTQNSTKPMKTHWSLAKPKSNTLKDTAPPLWDSRSCVVKSSRWGCIWQYHILT